jgi:hypothetical protein
MVGSELIGAVGVSGADRVQRMNLRRGRHQGRGIDVLKWRRIVQPAALAHAARGCAEFGTVEYLSVASIFFNTCAHVPYRRSKSTRAVAGLPRRGSEPSEPV